MIKRDFSSTQLPRRFQPVVYIGIVLVVFVLLQSPTRSVPKPNTTNKKSVATTTTVDPQLQASVAKLTEEKDQLAQQLQALQQQQQALEQQATAKAHELQIASDATNNLQSEKEQLASLIQTLQEGQSTLTQTVQALQEQQQQSQQQALTTENKVTETETETETINTANTLHSNNNDPIETDDENAAYWKWVLPLRNASTHADKEFKFLHRGVSGIGHDLFRYSNAFHLAKALNVTRLWLEMNPYCKGGTSTSSIPTHLFGAGPIVVPTFEQQERPFDVSLSDAWPKMVHHADSEQAANVSKWHLHFNNEVPGYTNGRACVNSPNCFGRGETDVEFYQQLMFLFGQQHQERIRRVTHQGPNGPWSDKIVFAIHVRAGNGETGDFANKGRAQANLDAWIDRVVHLIHEHVETHPQYFTTKQPLIFLATDTQHVLEEMRNASDRLPLKIPVESAVTSFLEPGTGVAYEGKQFDDTAKCLDNWVEAVLDMYLLSVKGDVVIAGQTSSFTKVAPASLAMEKARKQKEGPDMPNEHPHFYCQAGSLGDKLDCFDDPIDWYHGNPAVIWGNTASPSQGNYARHWPVGDGKVLLDIFKDTVIQPIES